MFMNARTKLLSVLGLSVAVLGAAAWTGDKDKKDEKAAAKIGQPAPAFTLKDTKGTDHTLSDFSGKIVVIEWFNPDCPYCKGVYEKGIVKTTLDQLKEVDPGIVYLAINSTTFGPGGAYTRDEVIEQSDSYLAAQKISIPVLIDYEGTTGRAYDAKTTPHMFVIDDKGVLRYHGAFTDDNNFKKTDYTNYVVDAVKQIKAGETVSPDYVKSWGCGVKYAKGSKNEGKADQKKPS
jgi:peroxiredoxin